MPEQVSFSDDAVDINLGSMSAMSDSLDEVDTPCSLGKKATIFHEGKGDVRTLSGGDHALITLHSPYQPPGSVHNRTAATAAAFCRGNRKCRQGEDMQMNMIQNSFPDLFTSECLLPWTKNSATQHKLLHLLNACTAIVQDLWEDSVRRSAFVYLWLEGVEL
ncbi:hypothetical protein Baya_5573 [Bagarius yarrelli]|uniref:Uncharacterized protein n=1 Tax=Bagarius yarrelli TaxID=175774 RepID=A0A556TW45_BAGYA|nr:hypothetical protein Baya_5573 [Bagarius yarrelli]